MHAQLTAVLSPKPFAIRFIRRYPNITVPVDITSSRASISAANIHPNECSVFRVISSGLGVGDDPVEGSEKKKKKKKKEQERRL